MEDFFHFRKLIFLKNVCNLIINYFYNIKKKSFPDVGFTNTLF